MKGALVQAGPDQTGPAGACLDVHQQEAVQLLLRAVLAHGGALFRRCVAVGIWINKSALPSGLWLLYRSGGILRI